MKMKLILFILLIVSFYPSWGQKQLEKLPSSINTDKYDELGPVLSEDNNRLYFTRTGDPEFINVISRKKVEKNTLKARLARIFSQISGDEIEDPETSSFNQDIFYARKAEETFKRVEHPGYPINNAYPNSVLATFPSENALVVLNRFDEEGGISKGFSKVKMEESGGFAFPKGMDVYDFNNLGNEVSMTMSPDAEQLFIAMERPDSKGETDIYLSIRIRSNMWSKPEPINAPINTIFRETAPFLSKDKRKLYFASNRPGGHGGMDIYVADRLDYTYKNWSEPRLLPVPINSEHDDSQPYLDAKGDYIYFTSKRDGTSDIWRYHLTAPKILEKPLTIVIRIIDEETLQPVRGEIFWGKAHVMGFDGFFRTYNGQYEVTLTENELVKFKVLKRGYIGDEKIIDPFEIVSDEVTKFNLDLYVRKADKDPNQVVELPYPFGTKRKITLRNIYFERSESKVLPQSFTELGKLVQVLKDVPALRIRVEGHSDNVGDKQLLLQLSEDRAEAIKAFLVDKGIAPERIETVGFGDQFPLNDNATEEERKRNRRVEIQVLAE
ncbi:OmpA family protein [Portibacter marinus]|uniref:OmpA family protein n=1 Tax=Portibacter marinus TaxID=2898660 RepID=UPI001F370037|nr:OmpA family protein [Portibacter marinus]